jgi:hypothetical protein
MYRFVRLEIKAPNIPGGQFAMAKSNMHGTSISESAIVLTMDDKLNMELLLNESRPRVYLLWAVLTGVGFTATHYYQKPNINGVWFVLSVIGLGYMYKVMPLRVKQMKRIFLAWLIPIVAGIVISKLAVQTNIFSNLLPYLGAFWLVVMAVGYFLNGLVDPPSKWYYVAAIVNLVAAGLCWQVDSFITQQYLIAAVVSVWSMLCLWVFRSDA